MDEQKVRENLMRLKYLEQQMQQVQQQLVGLERMVMELETTRYALDELTNVKKDTPAFLPLGSGVMASGVLKKADRVTVDVGSGTLVGKPVSEAKEMIDTKLEDVRKNFDYFQASLTTLEDQYTALATEVKKMTEE